MGIKHYVLNFEREFKDAVVEDFVSEYLSGKTPNPCIVCNEKIKFSLLSKKMRAIGFDLLATGHYASVKKSGGRFMLKKGVDPAKDQSYVLYRLKQFELSGLIFPLGGLTKKEVRRIAVENNLPAANKPESQEICFVDKDYESFIRGYVPNASKKIKPGPIIDIRNGRVIGKHRGIPFFTVGQRSGLNLSLPSAVYVTRIDPKKNTLYVGSKEQAYSKAAIVENITWVSGKSPKLPLKCSVKIRRLHPEAPAVISKAGKNISVTFKETQHAVTPGQAGSFLQ